MGAPTGNSTSGDKRAGILAYWNREKLCSLESSTSRGDGNLAYLDNAIEQLVLDRVLESWADGTGLRCIDVGAGYGRFTPTLRKFYSEIVLLEAAANVYQVLKERWDRVPGVNCVNATFEDYTDVGGYNLVLASGVVYLYDEHLLGEFLAKARSTLVSGGLLILRDFVSLQPRIVRSAYIEDGFCYYRSPSVWSSLCEKTGFQMLELRASKPRLGLLRRSRLRNLLSSLKLMSIVRLPLFVNAAMKFGDWDPSDSDISTTFIVMRAL